jgi:hypothetical protein
MTPKSSLVLSLALAFPALAQAQSAPVGGGQAILNARSMFQSGQRCGTPPHDPLRFSTALGTASDCAYSSTTIDPQYNPGVTLTIPVVVHVIQRTNGTGFISQAMVQSQIDILNEDFLALAGTNGAPGTNAKIQFELATVDPNGASTNGITYSSNNTWFGDGGNYWNTLAWDTNNYLNIYTNDAGGFLGYVPDFPQGGIVGSNADRVVVYWAAFGRNAPTGPPYNQGRTATHEVGHYLGLYHTFDGGCGGGNCYTSGDRICDTNPESSPTFGCPGNKVSCGSQDPIHNYMDYSDDTCMWEFTPEQVNRMRCTLEHWRPNLANTTTNPGLGTPFCLGDGSGTGCPCNNQGGSGEGCGNSNGPGAKLTASGSASISAGNLVLSASGLIPSQSGLYYQGDNSIAGGNGVTFGDGLRCTGANTIRLQIITANSQGNSATTVNIANKGGVTAGQTKRYQLWYRDPVFSPCLNGFNLSNGYEVVWAP